MGSNSDIARGVGLMNCPVGSLTVYGDVVVTGSTMSSEFAGEIGSSLPYVKKQDIFVMKVGAFWKVLSRLRRLVL